MKQSSSNDSNILVEHFFRNEYGKIVAVISGYLGVGQIQMAEDIVQDTLLTAVEYWKHNGIPPNPNAWLYTTAKNKTLNLLRRKKIERDFSMENSGENLEGLDFSDEQISDEQLRVMLKFCDPSISEDVQITLILKILCGFSISEISSAFCTNSETINKRLVRGRKKLRLLSQKGECFNDLNKKLEVLLKTIYLLFNEGYFPVKKNQVIRPDLCLEAIRLGELIVSNNGISEKQNAHALLSLMYLNASRFESRVNKRDETIEMKLQDRALWNQELINKGLHHLKEAQTDRAISKYLILASISANHSVANSFEETDWQEIVSLYDVLLTMEDSPIVQLNRLVAISRTQGAEFAISEIKKLDDLSEMNENFMYFSTLAELSKESDNHPEAIKYYKKAISLCRSDRDKKFFLKKLNEVVPIPDSQV